MTTQTQNANPTERGNPILRWIGGRIRRTLRFAFDHPIEAALLAFLLWIALTGLADANWQTVPQSGVAATVIAGEQQSFHDTIGVHAPAITDWALRGIGTAISFTSYLAATWMASFMRYLIQQSTAPALAPATAPSAPAHH